MLEQVAEIRNIAEHWHLVDGERVVGLDHASNAHRSAVGHQDLRRGLLREQSGGAVLIRFALVGRRVFHVHIQEDRSFRSDLRSYGQAQERVDVGYSRRTAQLRLCHDGDAHALLH